LGTQGTSRELDEIMLGTIGKNKKYSSPVPPPK
jgi:hypothetical protein